jgi:hypothetical protein
MENTRRLSLTCHCLTFKEQLANVLKELVSTIVKFIIEPIQNGKLLSPVEETIHH